MTARIVELRKRRGFFHGLTFWRLAKVAIFTTNADAENQTLINHKTVCGALNRHFCQTPVGRWHSHFQSNNLFTSAINFSKLSKLDFLKSLILKPFFES